MTDDKIALRALLEKGSDATFEREMIGFAEGPSGQPGLSRVPRPGLGLGGLFLGRGPDLDSGKRQHFAPPFRLATTR